MLRLRLKVMTVATTPAIMWSTSSGSEIMHPLAAPVLGGMVSSLLHILVVTPVLLAWLREREFSKTFSTRGDAFTDCKPSPHHR